jgi:hypothetical protein
MGKMNNNKKKLIEARQKCIDAKVGETIICPSCGTQHVKKSYQSLFCKSKGGTKCKDNYWNNVDQSKRCNTTRISPANARYLNNVILPERAREFGFPDVETMLNHVDDFDGSWDAHACHVEPCKFCGLREEYCECGDGADGV